MQAPTALAVCSSGSLWRNPSNQTWFVMRTVVPYLVLLLFVLPGCVDDAPPPAEAVDVAAAEQTLMQRSRDWAATVAAGDMEAALNYWADDAVILAPGMPPIRGRDAIREYLAGTGNIPGFRITWEPLEAHVSSSGDLAYLLERNEISMTDSTGATITEHNKVVTVWARQEDGSWKNVVDAWNAAPPPGQ